MIIKAWRAFVDYPWPLFLGIALAISLTAASLGIAMWSQYDEHRRREAGMVYMKGWVLPQDVPAVGEAIQRAKKADESR